MNKIHNATTEIREKEKDVPNYTKKNVSKKDGRSDNSKRIRIALVVLTTIFAVLFAGAFYGWGPMQIMLEENGAFSELCEENENIFEDNDYEHNFTPCAAQTSRLLNVHMVAMTFAFISAPFFGEVFDRFGILAFMCVVSTVALFGLGLLVTAVETGADYLLYPSFSCLGILGPSSSIIFVELGLLFQGRIRSLVISALNNVYDAGSVTYLGLWGTAKFTGVSLTGISAAYLGLAVACLGPSTYLWSIVVPVPEPSAAAKEEDDDLENSSSEGSFDDSPEQVSSRTEQIDISSDSAGSDESPSRQLYSEKFIWLLMFYGLHFSRATMTLTTSKSFLSYLGDDEFGHRYLAIFSFLMPSSILFGVPIVEYISHKYGFEGGLHAVNILSLAHGIIQISSDNLNVQVVGFVIFSFSRCFFFAVIFSFLPSLLDKSVVGKASGFLACAVGVFGFINIPLKNLAMDHFDGNFRVPYAIYLGITVTCFFMAHRIGVRYREEQGLQNYVEKQQSFRSRRMFAMRFSFAGSHYESLDDEYSLYGGQQ